MFDDKQLGLLFTVPNTTEPEESKEVCQKPKREMDKKPVTSVQEGINNEVKTVKQLSVEMKALLEEKYPYVWVRGELGPVKLHSSGHKYFSLKEEDFVINAICWKGTALSAALEEGAIVECYGRITLYAGRSSYQIIVREAREVNKQGNIFFQLEELKKKLTAQGLFDSSRKKHIPKFPESIAILTSPTGAVLHDIMHRITNRYPCCKIYFFPISVQGADSESSILAALDKVDKMENIDTVILARGGGSIEDLWIFNHEAIVCRVANMSVPIISAIGHETDTTLVDYAADLRAPTPTAAAELAVPDKITIQSNITTTINNSFTMAFEKLKQHHSFLENYSDYNYIYSNSLGNFGQKIDNLILTFTNNIQEMIARKKLELGTVESRTELFTKFIQQIEQYSVITNTIAKMRLQDARNLCSQNKMFLEEKEVELKEKILICDSENKKITSAKEAAGANELTLKFYDGNITAVPKKAS